MPAPRSTTSMRSLSRNGLTRPIMLVTRIATRTTTICAWYGRKNATIRRRVWPRRSFGTRVEVAGRAASGGHRHRACRRFGPSSARRRLAGLVPNLARDRRGAPRRGRIDTAVPRGTSRHPHQPAGSMPDGRLADAPRPEMRRPRDARLTSAAKIARRTPTPAGRQAPWIRAALGAAHPGGATSVLPPRSRPRPLRLQVARERTRRPGSGGRAGVAAVVRRVVRGSGAGTPAPGASGHGRRGSARSQDGLAAGPRSGSG